MKKRTAQFSACPGQHLVSAWYDAQGQWDASRAPALAQNVTFPRRRAVRSQ
jgi:hypothetical protein